VIPKHTIHIQNIFKNNIKQKKLGNLTTNSYIKKKRLMQFKMVKKEYTCLNMQSTKIVII